MNQATVNATAGLRVLMLEDSAFDAELIQAALAAAYPDPHVTLVADEPGFAHALASGAFDLVLSDVELPGYSGAHALAHCQAVAPELPFIFVSGVIGEENAVDLLKQGATDYVSKDRLGRLSLVIDRALRERAERSARRRAERQLREADSVYARVVDGLSGYGVILLDADGVIRDWNRAASLIFGYVRGEVIGHSMAMIYTPEDLAGDVIRKEFDAATLHGSVVDARWMVRSDGSRLRMEGALTVLRHEEGEVSGFCKLLRDVTMNYESAAALLAAKEEAERANRSKSVFLANMSHEIRTPLNAVLGFTQLLMADRKLPAETQSRLRVIHGAGNRLLSLINDVLDLAKIESGSLQVLAAPFDLMQELRDVDALYGAHARAKGLALQSELSLPVPSVVEGDRNKLGQIVANLLGNALKFTERGHIGLHAWRDAAQPDRVCFEVHDTGPGIADADLADLFVPFRQGAAGQEKGGTGLGLALSRDLARAMGGDLTVTSAAGNGTQVRFWLPLPPSRLPSAGAPVGEGAQVLDPATPCTVLVIEDDPYSRDVLVNLLSEAGCTVAQAFDGIEGLARCRSERFDIVFSDIRMPHMDGVEMITRLRADPFTATLPVVAVSASSLEHERRFYIENGFQDFIGKPYPFQEVYRALVDHAGVRLRPVAPAGDAEAGLAPAPLATGLSQRVRDQLRALASAAASGQLGAVGRLMEAIPPEAIGNERWRAFDDAAQAYDFQLLEERVSGLLAQLEAARAAEQAPSH